MGGGKMGREGRERSDTSQRPEREGVWERRRG